MASTEKTLSMSEIVQHEANRREETINALGRRLFKNGSAVSKIVGDEQAISPKMFVRLVKDFEVHLEPAVLRIWLYELMRERFGQDIVALCERAGWAPTAEDYQALTERFATDADRWG